MSALTRLRLKTPGLGSPFTSLQVAGRAETSTLESTTTAAHCSRSEKRGRGAAGEEAAGSRKEGESGTA